MIVVARFIMAGRGQAVMIASLTAMLALLVPLIGLFSAATLGLVTLRLGLREGLLTSLWATLACALLGWLVLGQPWLGAGFLVGLWLPLLVLGALVRATRSLETGVQAALGFGLLALGLTYALLGDPQVRWAELLRPALESMDAAAGLDPALLPQVLEAMAAWMTGALAAGIWLQTVLALFLARWWQALLYNPGGFGREFHDLRVSAPLAWLGAALYLWLAVQRAEAPALARDLGVMLFPLFLLQGLAVAHEVVARTAMSRAWLVALYLLLFFAMPYAELLIGLVGLSDRWLGFRTRIQPPANPNEHSD